MVFENIVEKRENTGNHVFSFPHNVFSLCKDKDCLFRAQSRILSEWARMGQWPISILKRGHQHFEMGQHILMTNNQDLSILKAQLLLTYHTKEVHPDNLLLVYGDSD